MKRREFIAGLGGVATWPVVAGAQQSPIPLVGFLSSRSPEDSAPHLEGFLRGLKAFGYVDGQTVSIAYRWAMGHYDRLPDLAHELASLHPAVIAAPGGTPSARAAKQATASIPVLFVTTDAVRDGLVASLNRPGGNLTGVDFMSGGLAGKRLELVAQLVSAADPVALLINPNAAGADSYKQDFELAAHTMGRRSITVSAGSDDDLETSFSTLVNSKIAALVVENDPFFDSRRDHLIALCEQHSIPAIYHIREFPAAGGLMSYGSSLVNAYYQMGVAAGRILKGARVEDLPVVRPTQFELVINVKTAKTLGLTVPPALIATADEVIE